MKTHVIRLEHHDDATSIRDKMSWSKAARILLAFPKRRIPALKALDLNLIQREAGRLGGQLALVTRDVEISDNAAALGIPVFTSIPEAQHQPWSRPRQKKHLVQHESRLPELLQRREEFRPRAESTDPRWLRIFGFSFGMAGIFALALFFIPTATITVEQRHVVQSLALKLYANPEITTATTNGGVPARLQRITVEGSLEGEANSFTTVADTKAEGILTLTNLTQSEVVVPAGTVFLSSTNPVIKYISIQAVTLLAGVDQKADVRIQAITAGANGNVAENSIQAIEGSIGLMISANNSKATTGGSDHSVRSASEQDYDQLFDKLFTSLSKDAIQQMTNAAGVEQVLIPSSLKLEKTLRHERLPAVGEPSDTINLTLRLEFSALSVDKKDFEQAARLALDASIPAGYAPGPNGIRLSDVTTPVMDSNGVIRWTLKAYRAINPVWDVAQTVNHLAGKTVPQAVSILNEELPLTDQPAISIFPPIWNRLPYLPFRIQMVEK